MFPDCPERSDQNLAGQDELLTPVRPTIPRLFGLIEAFQVVGEMPLNNKENPPVVVESVQHSVLQKGARYWVVAASTVETFAVWYLNSTGDIGPHGQRADRAHG